MRDMLLVLVCSSWILRIGQCFAPMRRQHVTHHHRTVLASSIATLPSSHTNNRQEEKIRSLLDQAVLLHQVATAERLPSQEDAERLVLDVSTALASAVEQQPLSPEELILQDISRQMDDSVMQACQQPDLAAAAVEQVEGLALQYHEVQRMAATSAATTTISDLTMELEVRLQDLQRLVKVHQMFPSFEEEMKPEMTVTETTVKGLDEELETETTLSETVVKESPPLTIHQTAKELAASTMSPPTVEHEPNERNIVVESGESFFFASDQGAEHHSTTATPEPKQFTPRLSNTALHASMSSYSEASSLENADLEIEESELETSNDDEEDDEVDIAIVGAGIGGLCAGAILNTLYGKRVGIYESHYLAGGCAHAFDRRATNGIDFTFDSGPTIVLGCSAPPYNPLRQVLNAVGQEVEWIPYHAWGMIENPGRENEFRWRLELGPDAFEQGPLLEFGGEEAQKEFRELRELTRPLVSGAVDIPAMAMRPGNSALIPLLRYIPALVGILKQGELSTGTFAPFMDGPIFTVKNPWFRSWLGALAFSLSGLPASRTAAAAMAYVLFDMHRSGAALDYPTGGLGSVIDALVKGVEQGSNGSKVHLRRHVESIDTTSDGSRITGLTLRGGKRIRAKEGVICNTPVWTLNKLIKNEQAREVLDDFLPPHAKREPRQSWKFDSETSNYVVTKREAFETEDSLFFKTDTAEQTGSFLHLHLAIKADGLDLSKMEAHYTVMDRSLGGDDGPLDGPCGELNMIAVSNPCVIDKSLAPEGYMVVHAYGAGNEPYQLWKDVKRNSPEYKQLKEERAQVLWRAVESIIPDVRDRVVLDLIGSPKTHERFLRRPNGTYGAATEDYLKDGSTPIESLVLAGDGIFPGIGVPAVSLNGASAANAFVSPLEQWQCLDTLKRKRLI